MAELRLIGVSADGRSLSLIDTYGNEHRLAIDDRLRAAVNGQLSRLGQLTMALESRISPREIQERIRAGESAEEVAGSAGVPLERVLRFVGPVLQEREHVAERARRARIAVPSGPSVLLADVVERHAIRQGMSPEDVVWDSARRPDHTWEVRIRWPDGATAAWELDFAHQHASPIDGLAKRLSGGEEEPPAEQSATVHRLMRVVPTPDDVDPLHPRGTTESTVLPQAAVPAAPPQATVPASSSTGARPAAEMASAQPVTASAASAKSAPSDEPMRDPTAADAQPTATQPAKRGRTRARVPKWDDIIFGMKPKTE